MRGFAFAIAALAFLGGVANAETSDGWLLVARSTYTAGVGAVDGNRAVWMQRQGKDRRFYPGLLKRSVSLVLARQAHARDPAAQE